MANIRVFYVYFLNFDNYTHVIVAKYNYSSNNMCKICIAGIIGQIQEIDTQYHLCSVSESYIG